MLKPFFCTAFLCSIALTSTSHAEDKKPADKDDETDISNLITGGSVNLELIYRYANISDDRFLLDADASTLRSALTFRSGKYRGFKVGGSLVNVTEAFSDDFNSTLNGNTQFPVEADPNATEIEEAFIAYEGFDKLSLSAGRRRIDWGNKRFFSSLPWRQNRQTYDGGFLSYKPRSDIEIDYAYVFNVNRIFTDDSPIGNFDSDSHMINAKYKNKTIGNLTGYFYSLNFDNAAALKTNTLGANLTGSQKLGSGWSFDYVAEVAHQWDIDNNPFDISETYWRVEPAIKYKGTKLAVGMEVLGGNGQRGFQTPLALLHAYNGFADLFLVTPGAGLEDFYVRFTHNFDKSGPFGGASFLARYHEFNADFGGQSYGEELDLQVVMPVFRQDLKLLLKAAIFDADQSFTEDVTKLWLQLRFVY